MKLFILVALLSCLAASVQAMTCGELPKNLTHDAIQACQPFIFNLYVSNSENDTCMQVYYFGNRNGQPSNAIALFQTENDAASFPVTVTTNKEETKWTVVSEDNPPITLEYYKLFFDDEVHYFCLYACDSKNEYITSLRCVAIDEAGHDEINEKLKAMPDLPLGENGYKDVYNCKSKPRVGGYRLASGSADKKEC